MFSRRTLLAATGVTLAAPFVARPGFGQAWPNRYVRLIVPYAPGGGNDAIARVLIARLAEIWGQQIVIENRPGAGSNVGTEAAARSEPDGYTILFSSLPHAINRFVYSSLPFDPVADFEPITQICRFPNLLGVSNQSPAKTVKELIDLLKSKRGNAHFASSGIGSSPHLCGELFKRMAGIDMSHVPYRGAGPALNDLIPGRVDMMFNTIGSMLSPAREGTLRGLAVTSANRFPTAPEYPTVAEAGVPGFEVDAWYSLFVPAKTPKELLDKINADCVAALRTPAINKRLEELGVVVVASTRAELAAQLKSEMDKWGPVIQSIGLKVQ